MRDILCTQSMVAKCSVGRHAKGVAVGVRRQDPSLDVELIPDRVRVKEPKRHHRPFYPHRSLIP
jgi:hypothetical protein